MRDPYHTIISDTKKVAGRYDAAATLKKEYIIIERIGRDRLKPRIIKLISKLKKSAKKKNSDAYYDLEILRIDLKPYPKDETIRLKLHTLKFYLGTGVMNDDDLLTLITLVDEYITHL